MVHLHSELVFSLLSYRSSIVPLRFIRPFKGLGAHNTNNTLIFLSEKNIHGTCLICSVYVKFIFLSIGCFNLLHERISPK